MLFHDRRGNPEKLRHVVKRRAAFQEPDGERIAEAMRATVFDPSADTNIPELPVYLRLKVSASCPRREK